MTTVILTYSIGPESRDRTETCGSTNRRAHPATPTQSICRPRVLSGSPQETFPGLAAVYEVDNARLAPFSSTASPASSVVSGRIDLEPPPGTDPGNHAYKARSFPVNL